MVYKFRVGQTDLGFVKLMKENPPSIFAEEEHLGGYNLAISLFDKAEARHVCFLLNKDLFEYDSNGWSRRRNVGRDSKYDWNSLGNALNGTTYVSPDDLEDYIRDDGDWEGYEYHFLKHNCQDFVKFCLNCVGAKSMSFKKGPCYRSQH